LFLFLSPLYRSHLYLACSVKTDEHTLFPFPFAILPEKPAACPGRPLFLGGLLSISFNEQTMEKNICFSEALLKKIVDGNRDAFRIFYDITCPLAYRYAGYFLQQKEDREEVVSEVFYIVWKQRETLLSIENIKAWLYTVCRNEAYRYLKQKEKYACISIDDMPVELQIDASEVDGELIEKEMLALYNEAIAGLPERCKLIFLMVREEHLRHKEVAEILSITEGTVAQQMNLAIRKIVEVVNKQYPSLLRKT
jgi:RNA polymerase sigma-70 factor (ECF subfamily)